MEMFNLKNIKNVESKSQYQVKIKIGLQLWKTWMMMMWTSIGFGKNIRENMKASATDSLGYYKSKQDKSWSDEECTKLLD